MQGDLILCYDFSPILSTPRQPRRLYPLDNLTRRSLLFLFTYQRIPLQRRPIEWLTIDHQFHLVEIQRLVLDQSFRELNRSASKLLQQCMTHPVKLLFVRFQHFGSSTHTVVKEADPSARLGEKGLECTHDLISPSISSFFLPDR